MGAMWKAMLLSGCLLSYKNQSPLQGNHRVTLNQFSKRQLPVHFPNVKSSSTTALKSEKTYRWEVLF